jgi:cytosine deaminase
LSRKQAVLNGEVDMTAAPLWLIQNVRLADRDGLWQIAIDKGRFGEITPMGRRGRKLRGVERSRRAGDPAFY